MNGVGIGMGARRQARRTTERLIEVVDQLTLVLSTVETDPIDSLRAVSVPLRRLAVGSRVLDAAAAGGESGERAAVESVRSHLTPLTDLVAEPEVLPPPFSPDLRQRIGYSIAVLVALRVRLRDHEHRLRTKPLQAIGDNVLGDVKNRWAEFRGDPSLSHLDHLHGAAVAMQDFYWVLGLEEDSSPRVRGLGRLCQLLEKATDREGDPTDVPAMMREITAAANDLCRPTRAEHRQWLESVMA